MMTVGDEIIYNISVCNNGYQNLKNVLLDDGLTDSNSRPLAYTAPFTPPGAVFQSSNQSGLSDSGAGNGTTTGTLHVGECATYQGKYTLDQAAIEEICDVLATTNSQVAFRSIAEEEAADLAVFLLILHHTSDELAKHASEILLALSPEKQAVVAEHVVKIEMADIDEVTAITHRIVAQITEASEKMIAFGDGKTNLINMLSDMSQEDRGSLLESLELNNEDLVTEINQTLFPFDDFIKYFS